MITRILYYLRHNSVTYLFKTVVFSVFVFFFLVSILLGNLSNLFEESFSNIIDHSVSVYTKYSLDNNDLHTFAEVIQMEQSLKETYQELKKEEGITYSDYWISTKDQYPLTASDVTDDNMVVFYNRKSTLNLEYPVDVMYLLEHGMNQKHETDLIYGTNCTEPKGIHADYGVLFDGRNFTEEEMNQGEMVGIVYMYQPGQGQYVVSNGEGSYGQSGYEMLGIGDDLKLSVYITNHDPENPQVLKKKTWNIKIIGMYTSKDAESGKIVRNIHTSHDSPIYLPYNTLMKIQQEMLEFELEENPAYMTMEFDSPFVRLDGMYFEMDTLQSMLSFRDRIEDTDLYKDGIINYTTGLNGSEALLANLFTITDSFKVISVVIMVLCILYCGLLTVLNAIFRRNEMAVLQALGETKKRIVLQMVVEQMLSLFVSLCISIPMALYVVRKVSYYLFNHGNSNVTFISKEMIPFFIRYTPYHFVLLVMMVVIMVVLMVVISHGMVQKFHARTLLSGDET